MGWLIALAVILLIAVLPLGISVNYDVEGARARIRIGPVQIPLFPRERKKKPKKAKEKPKKKAAASGKNRKVEKKENKGGSLTDFLPLVQVLLDFLADFRKKLRVNHLILRITMAGGDPCDLAVNYGKAWAILSGIMPQLERFFVIRHRDVGVSCDFVSDKILVVARLDLTMTVGRLLTLAVHRGIQGLVTFMKILNKRKGGASI